MKNLYTVSADIALNVIEASSQALAPLGSLSSEPFALFASVALIAVCIVTFR